MAIKVFSPIDFEDTSSGLSIDGDLAVDTNVLYVDVSTDRVGIGTSSPSAKLEVIGNINAGAGAADNYLQAKYSDSAHTRVHGYGLYMSRSASYIRPTTDNTQILYIGTSDQQWILLDIDASTTTFSTNGSEHLRIKSNGNVLIGTTTDSGFKLDVNGTSTFRDDVDMRTNAIDFKTNGSSTVPQLYGHRSATDLDSRDWSDEGGWAYTTFDANSSNAPNSGSGLHNANGLLSFNTHSGNYGHQIAMTTNTNKLYFRTRDNAAWQSWQEITTDSKDFIPAADSTYDIGSSSVRFANGYFDTLYGDGSNITNISLPNHSAALLTSGTLSMDRIADDAITGAKIAHNTLDAIHINASAVGASELNVSGNGSSGQVLTSDGDGTFSWTNKTTNTDTNYYLDGITKSGNTLTFSVNGATNQTYTFGSNAFNSTTIPTNNNQLTNGAGYITGYTETDTLNSVTGRGASTTNSVSVGGLTVNSDSATIGNSSQQSTNLNIIATNTAGAPAWTTAITMQGYEGRGQGIFFTDTANTNEEWFAGINYGNNWNTYSIGYDASGGQAEYTANAILTVKNNGTVGIGTTAPVEELDVAGTARMDTGITEGIHYAGTGFQHWGDGGTGMDFPSNDVISLKTNSAGRLYITSSGNVGIGTSSPDQKLHVSGNTKTTNLYVAGDIIHDGDADTKIQFDTNTINFDTAGSERLRINSSGNVGIGTNNPAHDLHVNGDRLVFTQTSQTYTDGSSGLTGIGIRNTGTSASYNAFGIQTGQGSIFQVRNDGHVIIGKGGTSDADSYLILNGGSGSSGEAFISLQRNSSQQFLLNTTANQTQIRNTGNLPLQFYTNDSTRMTIASNGNVGIGTTSPGEKLHISSGKVKLDNAYSIDFSDANWQIGRNVRAASGSSLASNTLQAVVYNNDSQGFSVVNSSSSALFEVSGASGNVYAKGNVGIGTTSPAHKLNVSSSNNTTALGIDFPSANYDFSANSTSGYTTLFHMNDTGLDIGHNSSSRALNLKTNSTDRLTITGGGNVLIGTTTDSGEKLYVSGSMKASSNILASNNVYAAGSEGFVFGSSTSEGEYIYRSGNDIRLRAGGSDILTVDGDNSRVGIGTTSPSNKLHVVGDFFLKGSDTSSSTKNFQVQTGDGTSIMDFRNDAYAFFGCGQGGGDASGFIFRYNSTFGVQFTGYNYGNGSSPSYKPILMDTDLAGRSQGVYINYGITGYTAPAPTSNTEFAVRGRGTSSNYTAKFEDSSTNPLLYIKDNGNVTVGTATDSGYKLDVEGNTNTNGDYHVNGNQGWSGTINIPTNPPIAITVEGGIITNVT